MKKADQKKLRTMYELGIPISKLSETFKVTPSQISGAQGRPGYQYS